MPENLYDYCQKNCDFDDSIKQLISQGHYNLSVNDIYQDTFHLFCFGFLSMKTMHCDN